MRQLVRFVYQIQKRKSRAWYDSVTAHAIAHGAKVKKTFEEVFPDFGDGKNECYVDPEAASIMDKLAEKSLKALKEKAGGLVRTSNKN